MHPLQRSDRFDHDPPLAPDLHSPLPRAGTHFLTRAWLARHPDIMATSTMRMGSETPLRSSARRRRRSSLARPSSWARSGSRTYVSSNLVASWRERLRARGCRLSRGTSLARARYSWTWKRTTRKRSHCAPSAATVRLPDFTTAPPGRSHCDASSVPGEQRPSSVVRRRDLCRRAPFFFGFGGTC